MAKIKNTTEVYNFKGNQYPCCSCVTMGVIGGKWKTVILFYLIDSAKRYNELRKFMPHVTERTLSIQHRQLEEDGIVKRKVYVEKPPMKVEYSLTELGKILIPVLNAIADWGFKTADSCLIAGELNKH